VSRDCKGFRSALEAELLGRPSRERLAWLSWNTHLLACGECRELLDREEALETLLASLPEPRLPEELANRVLSRLREDRTTEVRLDVLLDLDGEVRAPERLAADVLAGLARERAETRTDPVERQLDALLDLDREVLAPAGLAHRVLAGLAHERRRGKELSPAAPRRRRAWIVALAAGLLVVFLGRTFWVRMRPAGEARIEPVVRADPVPDTEMLAALDVLEEWDLLMQDDVDVLLSTLGPADVALLDY
jgi:hypothetical protein